MLNVLSRDLLSHEDMASFVFCGHVVTVRQGFLKGYRQIRTSALGAAHK